jgi:MFS transporter, ACS family, tartrate transporter
VAVDNESFILNRVAYRFIPFLMLCYFVNYLDRVNVGFAKLTMDADLGLSDTAFGFGAGIFFLAYFLFEVPSNVIMDRVGARIWISRIMFSWGIVSGAMAFIPQISAWTSFSPEHTFYGLRFLLGLAEAGFFPGIIFFLTLWFPASHRARIVGYFMAAIPLSSARLARQSRRRSLAFMGRAGSQAGNGSSLSRRCRRSFSLSSSFSI